MTFLQRLFTPTPSQSSRHLSQIGKARTGSGGASSLRADRAAGLRPQPPTASSQSSIPSALRSGVAAIGFAALAARGAPASEWPAWLIYALPFIALAIFRFDPWRDE